MTPLLGQRLRPDRSFERLYRRHAGDVYRYAFAILRNAADAEDVTQTTFLNAYRAYERGERPRTPHNWLIAIAHNVCRQRFRQSQRRVDEVAFDENVAEATVPDDEAPSADDIRRALGHLGFNQRAALVMRELEGRSYKEIAEILDVSVSAVETLIFRARRALREQLEGGLTCQEAELAISRQLDGALPRSERGKLRAHLRECSECAGLARRLRAQRSAIKALGVVPLPASLTGLFGGGSAAAATAGAAGAGAASAGIGTGLAVKAAAVVAAGAVAGGVGYEGSKHVPYLADDAAPPASEAKAEAKAAEKAAKAATKLDRPGRRVGVVRQAAGQQPGRRVGQTADTAQQKRAERAQAKAAREKARAARKAAKDKPTGKGKPDRTRATTTPAVIPPPAKRKQTLRPLPGANARAAGRDK